MKQFILLLLILSLTACGQNKFDGYMRVGKDSLQQGKYEEAVKQFDLALIEKPTDKDAALLMERASKELNTQKSKEILSTYQEENSPIYADYMKVFLETNLKDNNSGVFATIEMKDRLDQIYKRALDLGRKYNKYPDIAKAHDDFVSALDSYRNAFDEVKNNGSQFRVNQYKKLHDDHLQKYKDQINKLKDMK